MRRLVALVAALVCLATAPAAVAGSWAKSSIKQAVKSGLMGPSVEKFRPNAPLTRAELGLIVAGITQQAREVTNPDQTVTMTQLNRALVRALGLYPASTEFEKELKDAGLAPPARAGWETVARLLGLRYNHPSVHDDRELLPNDPASRAETAYSVARILHLSQWDLQRASDLATAFDLPNYGEWQKRVLSRAVRFVGYPYVWGGTSEYKQTLFGVTSRGGFDCSGFVWRVYKLQAWPEAPKLGTTIHGRTTYAMAGEMRRTARVKRAKLKPADVIFYGSQGPKSKPGQITHTGISLGNGWFVHSSGQGTTIHPLEGWYVQTYAWGRRPLREAGLG